MIRVSLKIGRLPAYDNPDPSYLFQAHRHLIASAFEISLWGSIALLLAIIIFHKWVRIEQEKPFVWIYVLGVGLIVFNLLIDPLFSWFLD